MKNLMTLIGHNTSAKWDSDMFLTKIPIAPCYCQMMG